MLEALENARSLAGQLLTYSSGGAPATASHSLRELLDRSARFVLSGSGVSVDLAVPEDLWRCEVDPLQIRQVVDNLVLNARQAMPRGGHVKIAARNTELGAGGPAGVAPGRYVEVGDQRRRPRHPRSDPRSRLRGLLLHQGRRHRPRPRHGALDRRAARRRGRLRVSAGGGNHLSAVAEGRRPPRRRHLRRAPASAGRPTGPARGRARILVMDDEAPIRKLIKVGLGMEG